MLFGALIVFGTICAIIVTFLLFNIESEKEEILLLFIQIRLSSVEEMSKRRDKFMEYYDVNSIYMGLIFSF